MPADIIQSCTFPGVSGIESATYVCSHGVSPGRAVIQTYPEAGLPLEFGNLTFTDGRRTVVIRGCKVDKITPRADGGGISYTIELVDERWQWGSLGGISGHYNQRDNHGKLVPWTIRSPAELAQLCFRALAIRNGAFVLPAGLTRAMGANVDRFLKAGENFPPTMTNPEMIWEHTPPGEALSQLADVFGCRVIYQPAQARVLVAPVGKGKAFPDLPCEVIGETIDGPEAPAFVGVFGSPTKVQARFLLEAVGEEWDGRYLPINQLSYSPINLEQQTQRSHIKYVGGLTVENLAVRLAFIDPKTGEKLTLTVNHTGAATVAQRLNGIAAKLLQNATVNNNLRIVFDGTIRLVFVGKTPFPFELSCYNPSGGNESFVAEFYRPHKNARQGCWDFSNPPVFANVQPTDRLSYVEARSLAQRTVFRCYRILNRDPHDIGTPHDKPGRQMELPFFGKVKRRQQIVLQDTMVEQVVPRPRIPGAIDKGNKALANVAGQGALPEFYNAYSRDRKAVVYGSIWKRIGNVNWAFSEPGAKEVLNTEPEARVFVEFSVNQMEQMIVFSEPVFYFTGGVGGNGFQCEPVLTLETGCFFLDEETNAPRRWEEMLRIPGGIAPIEWQFHEDIKVGVVGAYSEKNKLVGSEFLDLAFTKGMAGHYLRGQAAKWQLKGGEIRQYIGIVPIDPDGYCQQVSYSVGAGATTTVGGNTEFHPFVPQWAARRFAENLPPDQAAAAVNMIERDFANQAVPKEAK